MTLLHRWVNSNFVNSDIKMSKLSIWINVDSKGKLYFNIVKTSQRYYKLFIIDIYNTVSCYSTRSITKLTDFIENFYFNKEGVIWNHM